VERGAADDPIRHVVVLTLENHSFDQMLGCLKGVYPTLDGIDPDNLHSNSDGKGNTYIQSPTTERQMMLDPHHEVGHVAIQLRDGNQGFVEDFVKSYPDAPSDIIQYIMGYYPLDFLPALHALGKEFTVCDHWFSSLPGPTWPNRFFALTGTSNGRVNMPDDGTHSADLPGYFQQDQDTIFDRLTEKGINWKVYFHDIPQSWVLKHQRMPHNVARYFYVDGFFKDAAGAEQDFPEFCFIEPDFMGINENDDHPPHDVMKAEKLIADVYNALRANERLWLSTLFIIFYDEHGGFYDHVAPPAAVPPDGHNDEYSFDRFGVRVPAILISPWVERKVDNTQFDHTSVLKYLAIKWDLSSLPSERIERANSIGIAITRTEPRKDTIARISFDLHLLTPPDPEKEEEASNLMSAHHSALQKLGAFLPTALWEHSKADTWEQLPDMAARAARVFEWAKAATAHFLESLKWVSDRILATLYDDHGLMGSIAKPDKLGTKYVWEKDNVARFLLYQKPRAIPGLAKRIDDKNLPVEVQKHALRTLALITGRKFHHYGPDEARSWLNKRAE